MKAHITLIASLLLLLSANNLIAAKRTYAVGIFDIYDTKGKVTIEKINDNTNKFTDFYPNSNRISLEGIIKNDVPIGAWRSYYCNGMVYAQALYLDSGFYIRKKYYPDGTIERSDRGYTNRDSDGFSHILTSYTDYDFDGRALDDQKVAYNKPNITLAVNGIKDRPKIKMMQCSGTYDTIIYSLRKPDGILEVCIYVLSSENEYYKISFSCSVSSDRKITISDISKENVPDTWDIIVKPKIDDGVELVVSGLEIKGEKTDIGILCDIVEL